MSSFPYHPFTRATLRNTHQLQNLLTGRIPLTWPFAIIPVIPNFPMFYVIWRAWSHYKAWRGAVYLEQILQAGLIVEKSDKRLDEVYAAKGQTAPPRGAEDHAPDETHGRTAASPSSTSVRNSVQSKEQEEVEPKDERRNADDAKALPDQAKGLEGSVDGTATPDSMVFKGREEVKPAQEAAGKGGKAAGGKPPRLHHPALLISPAQVPLLVRTFGLRQAEEMEIDRAVEQAELRLKKADEKAVEPKA